MCNLIYNKYDTTLIKNGRTDVQWSLPKRTLREADNPLQRTNLVARIEFAKHVILKQSPEAENSSEQRTGNWARMACLNAKLSPKNGQPEIAPNNFHGHHKIYIILRAVRKF